MSSIKNVALAGASGSMGTAILNKLQASGKFNLTILRRKESPSTFPSSLKVVDVDYASVDELTAALKGQDAVISTLGTMQVAAQIPLIDAAVAAGVKRFLPSDFGSDLDVPSVGSLPIFKSKMDVHDHLIAKSKTTPLTYTFVYNNAFLDWGLENKFLINLSEYKPTLLDGGDSVFSATTLSGVADGVVGVLTHPEETKNRVVRIESTKISQKKIFEIAKKAAPEKPWAPEVVKLDDLVEQANQRVSKGIFDRDTVVVPYLWYACTVTSHANFTETQNELLGVKEITDDEVAELVKKNLS